ncbi:MAG: YfhO family protein [Butyrivibrio sp.]|nr:YfhO family protein [Butyrivibrio sp.]
MAKKIKNLLNYLIYTLVFTAVTFTVFHYFMDNGKLLINHADTWRQYIKAVAYYSKWMRGVIHNIRTLHFPIFETLSHGMGYGSDIYTTLQYYAIGDILNIPAAFVKTEYIYIYIQVTTILRAYLAGITLSLFLRYIKPNMSFAAVMTGMLTYSFGSFFMFYGIWHPYFANPLIYLPLVLLGAEKLLREKKPAAFIFAVFLAGTNSFYFFYVIVLLTIVYCLVRLIFMYKKEPVMILKSIGTFMATGAVGLFMSMVILLPVLLSFSNNPRSGQGIRVPLLYEFTYYKELIRNLTSFVNHGLYETQLGFTPIIVIALFYMLIMSVRENWARHACTYGVLLALFLSIPYAGYTFAAFSYVTNRWSFACALFAAYIMAEFADGLFDLVMDSLNYLRKKHFDKEDLKTQLKYKFPKYLVTLAVLLLTVFYINKNGIIAYSPEGENLVSDFMDKTTTEDMYLQLQSTEVQVVEEAAANDGLDPSNDFYRYSGRDLVWNASLLDGISSTQFFWSLADKGVSDYFMDLAVTDQQNFAYYALDDRAILNSMGGVNYFSLRFNTPEERAFVPYGYNEVYDKYNFAIFENTSALPLGATYNRVISRSDFEKLSPVERQEAILYGIVLDDEKASDYEQAEPIFTSSETEYELSFDGDITETENGFEATAGSSVTLSFEGVPCAETYLYFENLNVESYEEVPTIAVTAELPDGTQFQKKLDYKTKESQYYSGWHNFIVNMGYSETPKEYLRINFTADGTYTFDSLKVCFQKLDNLTERLNALSEDRLEDVNLNKNPISFATAKITGTVNLEESKIMLLSIPFSKGWTAYVDGKKETLLKANTMFMALPLSEGYHEIVLKYNTPGMLAGFILTLLGFAVFFVILKKQLKRNSK